MGCNYESVYTILFGTGNLSSKHLDCEYSFMLLPHTHKVSINNRPLQICKQKFLHMTFLLKSITTAKEKEQGRKKGRVELTLLS